MYSQHELFLNKQVCLQGYYLQITDHFKHLTKETQVSLENIVSSLRTPSPTLFFLSSLREGNGTPLQYSYLENPMDGGAW